MGTCPWTRPCSCSGCPGSSSACTCSRTARQGGCRGARGEWVRPARACAQCACMPCARLATHRIVVAREQQLVDGQLDHEQQEAEEDGRGQEAHVAAPVAFLVDRVLAEERARLAAERRAAAREGDGFAQPLLLAAAARAALLQHLHLRQRVRGGVVLRGAAARACACGVCASPAHGGGGGACAPCRQQQQRAQRGAPGPCAQAPAPPAAGSGSVNAPSALTMAALRGPAGPALTRGLRRVQIPACAAASVSPSAMHRHTDAVP